MAKLTLNDITNLTGNPTSAEQALNANFAAIETAVENTLSRDGTTPNSLEASLDANSQRIINLPYALSDTEPVTLAQVLAIVSGGDWTGGVGVPAIVFYQDAEPTATAAGQVWVKPSDLTIWIWNGTAWVRQADPNLNLAISTANAAASQAAAAAASASSALGLATSADAASTANTSALDALTPRVLAVEQDVAAVESAIIEIESDAGVLAATVDTVSADLGDLTSAVQNEAIARISGDEALAAAISVIQSTNAVVFIQASAPVAGVGGVPDPIPEFSFWYDSDDGNHPYRWVDGSWQSVQDEVYTTLTASITAEQIARIAADDALAADITTIQATRDADYALILSNDTARVDGDAALAASISTLTSNFNGLSSTVSSNYVTLVNADSALSSSITSLTSSLGTTNSNVSALSATVSNNYTTLVNADSALASQLTSLSSTVNGHTTTITSHTASINGIEGKYSIKIDANGYVTGFGLVSTNNNATPTSTFTVLADNFKIVTPGAAPVTPFQVISGTTYIKNVVIDSATIGTASIDTIKLANQSVTDVFSATFDFLGNSPNTTANTPTNLTTAVGTAEITVTGLPTSGAKVHIRGYFNAKRSGGTAENCNMRIRRNDGVVLSSTPEWRLTADFLIYAWEWIDPAPVSASHTYTVQVWRNATGATGDWEDIQLVATVLKR